MDEKSGSIIISSVGHLLVTIFLHNLSTFMVNPVITDVTMAALCPGQDECSLAIYLSGFQQAIMGMGSLVVMPLIGTLSDQHGRKAVLTVPIILTIIPLGILGYSRSRNFFYVYYVVRTLTGIVCDGTVNCLALAFLADEIPERQRASGFGFMSGIGSASFVMANLFARFLSISSTFQMAALVAVVALAYMRVFLPDSTTIPNHLTLTSPPLIVVAKQECTSSTSADEEHYSSSNNNNNNFQIFGTVLSIEHTVRLVKSSVTFLQAAVVAFFSSLADVGLQASFMQYYLKARFHFSKDQFAELMVIGGIAGTLSLLLVMPIVTPALGEARMLSIGLFFSCIHMILYSLAWASWVPYVSVMFSVLYVFWNPCMRSIVSKQVGPCEQGKAQGCISGITSFANVISPLVFSPLTALFLSDRAPFHFPGFSIMCVGFASMIAFIQSLMIRVVPTHRATVILA